MRKLQTVFLLFFLVATTGRAQINVQLHYDLGHSLYADDLTERPSTTATIEMFHPDRWGSTFFFVDLDFYTRGMSGAYLELAREFNLTKNKQWAAHIEYNGGVSTPENLTYGNRFQQAVLLGGAWNWHSADYSRTFSLQTMYKYYFRGQQPYQNAFSGFQLTEVWGITFAHGLCTFSGFCDLWYDQRVRGNWILMSEPQFWFNLNTLRGMKDINLSIGTELEISNNFVWTDKGRNDRFYVIPTLAAKWTF